MIKAEVVFDRSTIAINGYLILLNMEYITKDDDDLFEFYYSDLEQAIKYCMEN